MVGDFIFVLFYGGVLISMGVFARWMLSNENFNIKNEVDNTEETRMAHKKEKI